MTDYFPLLSRAVAGLERNTGEARRSVYDRARQALLRQLRSMNPPLAESEITRERLALEEAIRKIEAQAVRPADRPTPAPPPAPPPAAPPPVAAPPSPAWTKQPEPLAERAPPPPFPTSPAAAPPPPPPPPLARAPSPAMNETGSSAHSVMDDLMALGVDALVSDPAAAPQREVARSAPPPPPPMPKPQVAPTASPAQSVSPPPTRPASGPVIRNDVSLDTFTFDDAIPEPAPSPAAPPSPRTKAPEPSVDAHAAPAGTPRPFRGRNMDYAKADARKAMKAKLILGGTIAGLFAVAVLIGIVHRDRIFSMGSSTPRPVATTPPASEPPKSTERVPSDTGTQQQVSRPTQQQGSLAAAIAQRAVLYEENPSAQGGQQLQTFVGTAIWRTETVSPGPGRPPELGMRVEIEIPDRKMTVLMTVRRNPDTTLPASHTVEVQFTSPGDPFGGVSNVPGLRAKTTETAQGAPLSGLVVRVMPGFFLIGLSAIDADREQNLMLLRERGWLDLPFVYNNGRRAVLVIEKGNPGERVMNEALAAWGG